MLLKVRIYIKNPLKRLLFSLSYSFSYSPPTHSPADCLGMELFVYISSNRTDPEVGESIFGCKLCLHACTDTHTYIHLPRYWRTARSGLAVMGSTIPAKLF